MTKQKPSISLLIIDLIVEIKKNFLNKNVLNIPIIYLLIFKILEENKGARVSDLSEIFGISKPSITEIIQKMEDRELVYKKPGIDKRDRNIFLTEKGIKEKAIYKEKFKRFIDKRVQKMSKSDKDIFKKNLESIINILQK